MHLTNTTLVSSSFDTASDVSSTPALASSSGDNGYGVAHASGGERAVDAGVINCFFVDPSTTPALTKESKAFSFVDPTILALNHQSKSSVESNVHSKLLVGGKPSTNVGVDALENGPGSPSDEGETWNNDDFKLFDELLGPPDDAKKAPTDDSFAAPASNRQNDLETQADFEWNPCVCGKNHDDSVGTYWIECNFCGKWSKVDTDCVGFTENQAKTLPSWFCSCCKHVDESPEDIALMKEPIGIVLDEDLLLGTLPATILAAARPEARPVPQPVPHQGCSVPHPVLQDRFVPQHDPQPAADNADLSAEDIALLNEALGILLSAENDSML